MHLVSHCRTSGGEYVSEWRLAGVLLRARSNEFGTICNLAISPIAAEPLINACELPDEAISEGQRLYFQALALLSQRLSMDDPLLEVVMLERLRVEQEWLAQSTWRDERPCHHTAIPITP